QALVVPRLRMAVRCLGELLERRERALELARYRGVRFILRTAVCGSAHRHPVHRRLWLGHETGARDAPWPTARHHAKRFRFGDRTLDQLRQPEPRRRLATLARQHDDTPEQSAVRGRTDVPVVIVERPRADHLVGYVERVRPA